MNRCPCSRGAAWLSTPAGPRCAWCVTEMWQKRHHTTPDENRQRAWVRRRQKFGPSGRRVYS